MSELGKIKTWRLSHIFEQFLIKKKWVHAPLGDQWTKVRSKENHVGLWSSEKSLKQFMVVKRNAQQSCHCKKWPCFLHHVGGWVTAKCDPNVWNYEINFQTMGIEETLDIILGGSKKCQCQTLSQLLSKGGIQVNIQKCNHNFV